MSKFLGGADGNSTLEPISVSRITSLPLCFASRHHDHGKQIKQVALILTYLLSISLNILIVTIHLTTVQNLHALVSFKHSETKTRTDICTPVAWPVIGSSGVARDEVQWRDLMKTEIYIWVP
jgi:hypothetical protein